MGVLVAYFSIGVYFIIFSHILFRASIYVPIFIEIGWITDGDISYLNSFVGDSLELLSCTSYSFLRSRIYVQVSFCTYFSSIWIFPFCSIISTYGLVSNSYILFFINDIDMIESWPFRIFPQVFSAFGFVHKIATFEKAAGFQVWSTALNLFEISFILLYLSYSMAFARP